MAKLENIEGFPKYYMSKMGRLFSNKSGYWVELKPSKYKIMCGKAQKELAELHGVSKSAIKHIVKKYNHYKSIFRDEF